MSWPPAPRAGSKRGAFIVAAATRRLPTWTPANLSSGASKTSTPASTATSPSPSRFSTSPFVPKGVDRRYVEITRLSDAIEADDDSVQQLVLLISFAGKSRHPYSLVELVVSAGSARVGMVRPITSYSSPVNRQASERPRVHLPKPAVVAYVVFDRAVIVASIAQPPDTPDSQLQGDSHVVPATFEDVIDLQNTDTLEIVGSGLEEPQGVAQELEGARPPPGQKQESGRGSHRPWRRRHSRRSHRR